MRKIFLLVLLLNSPYSLAVTQYTEVLKQSEWPQYVNGTAMVALPQFRETLRRFEESDKINIEIRYPGGDQGRQWAESFGNWLVSFGVPLKYIQLFSGSGSNDQLLITLIDRR